MSFAAITERLAAIQKLIAAASAAQRLPADRRTTAMSARMEDQWRDGPVQQAFAKVRDRFADEEQRHGEIARDRELKRLAVELDRLRADLPDLAAAARFDLLDLARDWRS